MFNRFVYGACRQRAACALRALLLLAGLAGLPAASAATLALLVGVNQYPSLAQQRQLRGPANDVVALREILQQRGVAVQVLSDAAPAAQGMPTRAAILSALDQMLASSQRGDWLLLYLAGHGSQQPAPAGSDEPDGLDEIFLPQDIGRWESSNGVSGGVRNALVDDEIGRWLQRASQSGRRVWLLVDTCHAGDMAKALPRGQEEAPWWRTRHVPPQELGIPGERFQTSTLPRQRKSLAQMPIGGTFNWPGVVVFYAAQANEPTPEELLPVGGRTAVHGLFTASVLRTLEQGQAKSFRQLLSGVQGFYQNRPFPTPWGQGALDEALPWLRR